MLFEHKMNSVKAALSSERFAGIPEEIRNQIALEILLNEYEEMKKEYRAENKVVETMSGLMVVYDRKAEEVSRTVHTLSVEMMFAPRFNTLERTNLLDRLISKIDSLKVEKQAIKYKCDDAIAKRGVLSGGMRVLLQKIINMSIVEGVRELVADRIEKIDIRDMSQCL